MIRPVIEALYYLLRTELIIARRGFPSLHGLLRSAQPLCAGPGLLSAALLCDAVDTACVIYPKSILCLQRSAATALLLRRHGFAAEFVIGAQILPFKSHAWVELHGCVINDKSYTPDLYRELERC
jgi:hypothetical protein